MELTHSSMVASDLFFSKRIQPVCFFVLKGPADEMKITQQDKNVLVFKSTSLFLPFFTSEFCVHFLFIFFLAPSLSFLSGPTVAIATWDQIQLFYQDPIRKGPLLEELLGRSGRFRTTRIGTGEPGGTFQAELQEAQVDFCIRKKC